MCLHIERLPKFTYREQEYITWQEDEFCRVGFSEIPDIENKLINTQVMKKDEIKRAKKKPFYLGNTVKVCLTDKRTNQNYLFTIYAGYSYDGASIPRIFWRLIGSKESIEFKVAALIHDVLCENHCIVNYDRYFADRVFEKLLEVSDVNDFYRWLMFHTMDNFQKTQGWNKERKNDG